MKYYVISFFASIALIVLIAVAGYKLLEYAVNETATLTTQYIYKNNHVFCKECCWKNNFRSRTVYTCTEDRDQLWKKSL